MNDGNVMRLRAALNGANGKAQKHTAVVADILALSNRAERSLIAAGIPGRARAGAEVVWHAAGPMAKAYGYKMTRTYLTLTRGTRDWFLTEVKRVGVYPQQSERYRIGISTAQRDHIVATALRTFEVRNTADDNVAAAPAV
ncbi:hypothetical protein ASG57_08070 [Bradyrhizobium sp. Leaf396]|nr:hypothetical protein ASG57_08070 [Bradyrhizobium sp. Leaf396]